MSKFYFEYDWTFGLGWAICLKPFGVFFIIGPFQFGYDGGY